MRRLTALLMQVLVSPLWLVGLLVEPLSVAFWTGRALARRFVVWALVDPDEVKRRREKQVEETKKMFPGCNVYYNEQQDAVVVERGMPDQKMEKH